MSNERQMVDPICAMCRIILLNFKGNNTKISFCGSAISLQEPTITQGIFRYYNGNCKEDIFELFYVVIHIITWFLTPVGKLPNGKSHDENFIKELKKMTRYMCVGLQRLQNTYRYGNVVITLQYYINMLEAGLNGTFDIRHLPHCLVEDVWIDTPLRDQVINLWDYERIHRVCTIYEDCFQEVSKNSKMKEEIICGYLSAIEQLLTSYERDFCQRIGQ